MTRTSKRGWTRIVGVCFAKQKTLIRVHPWISVFIPVKYCDIDGGARQRQQIRDFQALVT